MAFKMKRGAAPKYKDLGSSAFQHTVDDVKSHQFDHSDDLQTDEEHSRAHWPDGKKRTKREMFDYDETKKEEKKEEDTDETSMLEEGRTDLSATTEKGPEEEEEEPLAMKSPVKHNGSPQEGVPTSADTEHNTWHANKDYESTADYDPNSKKVWDKEKKEWKTIKNAKLDVRKKGAKLEKKD